MINQLILILFVLSICTAACFFFIWFSLGSPRLLKGEDKVAVSAKRILSKLGLWIAGKYNKRSDEIEDIRLAKIAAAMEDLSNNYDQTDMAIIYPKAEIEGNKEIAKLKNLNKWKIAFVCWVCTMFYFIFFCMVFVAMPVLYLFEYSVLTILLSMPVYNFLSMYFITQIFKG